MDRYTETAVKHELLEDNTHSFIVKIWLEESAEKTRQAVWRGRITHVPNGERRYVKDLDGITSFIIPYLAEMEARLGLRWEIKMRLARLSQFLRRCFGIVSKSQPASKVD
jgi:hypothetical protein